MGTPPFMSPEQARNSAEVAEPADIYGLGATLYALVCGRPPFQAAVPMETMRQVIHEEPVRPAQLNPAIDRDLETICIKCLQKDASRRYETAAVLADDLNRYLQGRPILARPMGAAERAMRWCRRNPLAATSMALAAIFLLTTSITATIGFLTTRSALRGQTEALQAAQESYQSSRGTVKKFFVVVSEDLLLDQPGMQPLREQLLRLALDEYERFLERHAGDPDLAREIALTHYQVGLIAEWIDDSTDRAMQSLETARSMQRKLKAAAATDGLMAELGDTLNAIGRVHTKNAAYEAAMTSYTEALKLRTALRDQSPLDVSLRRRLANTQMNIGLVHRRRGDLNSAAKLFGDAQEIRRSALDDAVQANLASESLLLHRDLGIGYYNQANLALRERSAAKPLLLSALEHFARVQQLQPSSLNNATRVAACHHLLARLHMGEKSFADARLSFEKALETLDDLTTHNPHVTEFQEQLAALLLDSGTLHEKQQDAELALSYLERARGILEVIVPSADSKQLQARRRNYAVTLRELARVEVQLGHAKSARKHLVLSRDYLQQLVDQATASEPYARDLASTQRLLRSVADR